MKKKIGLILFLTISFSISACSTQLTVTPNLPVQQKEYKTEFSPSTSTPTRQNTPQDQNSPNVTLSQTTATIANQQVIVTMQGDTNCRSGPGTRFPILKIITSGEQVEVIGRYILDNYYFVSLAEDTNNACWVWADFSSMAVDSSVLPIVAAPPAPTVTITPTPTTAPADFNLSNPWFDKCEIDSVNYYIPQFEIVNTGTIHFQSIRAVLTNETTLDTFVYEYDYFRGSENCSIDNDGEIRQLFTGASTDMVLRGNRMLQENPTGTEFSLKVTLFAKDRQEGISVTREINFTP